MVNANLFSKKHSFNPLPDGLGFSKAYNSKHKRAKNLKKLQLSDDIIILKISIYGLV
jgi:hypothetical protein